MQKPDFPPSQKYIVFFFLSSALLLNFIIPPFQNPDEPQHFGTILTFNGDHAKKDRVETEILSFMYRNMWPRFVGMGRPKVPPESFSETKFLTFSDFRSTVKYSVLYHIILSQTLNIAFENDIIGFYYFCRLISFLLILASVLLCYSLFRNLFKIEDLDSNYLYWGAFFILFNSQFLISSISVNSDALSLFVSTVFFYASFRLIIGKFKVLFLALCILSSALGVFIDKSGYLLIFMVLFLPLFVIKGEKIFHALLIIFFCSIFPLFIVFALMQYFPTQIYSVLRNMKALLFDNIGMIPQIFSFSEFNKEYLLNFTDTFFLKFGWMAYSADRLFYWVWRIFLLSSTLGVVIFLGKYAYSRVRTFRLRSCDSPLFRIILFSLIAIFTQIINVRIYQGTKFILPQGRYLFPLILPIAFIFILGLKSFFELFHKRAGQVAIMVFVLFQFFFFNYVVWNYLIPVFHLTVKSPHPGI